MNTQSHFLEIIQGIVARYCLNRKPSLEVSLINTLNCAHIYVLLAQEDVVSRCGDFLLTALQDAKQSFSLTVTVQQNGLELHVCIDSDVQLSTLCVDAQIILSDALNIADHKLQIVDLLTEDEHLYKSCITLVHNTYKKHKLEFMLFSNVASGCVQLEDVRHLDASALEKKLHTDSHVTHLKLCSFTALIDFDAQQKYAERLLVWPFFDTDLIDLLANIPNFSRLSILVADDSLPSQLATKVMLEMLGCAVTCAENGVEALKLALNEHFDLLLLDERMPEMFGSEVIFQLTQQDTPNNNTPKVVLTGLTDDAQIAALFDKGVTHYLQKPVTKAVLEKFIKPWKLV